MPTYDYQCQDCGHRVEYFQPITEPARTVCPRCQGRLKRMVSAGVGLIFKGSGFYITDYKKKDNGDGKRVTPAKKEETPGAAGDKAAADKSSASD